MAKLELQQPKADILAGLEDGVAYKAVATVTRLGVSTIVTFDTDTKFTKAADLDLEGLATSVLAATEAVPPYLIPLSPLLLFNIVTSWKTSHPGVVLVGQDVWQVISNGERSLWERFIVLPEGGEGIFFAPKRIPIRVTPAVAGHVYYALLASDGQVIKAIGARVI